MQSDSNLPPPPPLFKVQGCAQDKITLLQLCPMSVQQRNPGVGGTLTGGIQDITAILPILGTDKCERHVGSALRGGYLYAGSTPLSIFGCLGIVKAGVGVLVSSISIPKFWVSHRNLRLSGAKGTPKQSMFLSARMLEDAGFKLQGDVAPLIGMDGTRFKAETKFIQILEEKHIDNPGNVSIKWKSQEWNILLVFSTIVIAIISGAPYFALLLGPASWQPTTKLPWLFPLLRTVGSCLATVCCQFIIQFRVISIMKNRILFMDIHRQIVNGLSKDNKANLDDWLKYHLQWDGEFPAEQCIWNLEQVLSSCLYIKEIGDDAEPTKRHISIEMATEKPPPKPVFETNFEFHRYNLRALRDKHFPSIPRNRVLISISWIILFLSLPATIIGYVGCFTLVSSTPSQGSGALVWLILEVTLSIIRIFIWAWNPKFDEDTDVTVELELVNRRPFDWTEELNAYIHDLFKKRTKQLTLYPERRFLEAIAAYSGPLDSFRSSENIALYFTPVLDSSMRSNNPAYVSLLITVFDFNARIGVTLLQAGGYSFYFDVEVKYEAGFSKINAILQPTMKNIDSWQARDGALFSSLESYYTFLVHTLNRTHKERDTAELERNWDLSPKTMQPMTTNLCFPPSLDLNILYLNRGYEQHLKTKLIGLWGSWIEEGMRRRISDGQNDCYEALKDATSEKAKWELTELDRLGAWEWTRRELSVVMLSFELEEYLRHKFEKCLTLIRVESGQQGWRSKREVWMRSVFELGRRNRLEREKATATERMQVAMNMRRKRAEREMRQWRDQGCFGPKWQECIQFIDTVWSQAISEGPIALRNAEAGVDKFARIDSIAFSIEETARYDSVDQVKGRLAHWRSQRGNELYEMEMVIDRILCVGEQREQLESAYAYPAPDKEATFKFAYLRASSSKGKACSAAVYDAKNCPVGVVCGAIQKGNTRSVINVDPEIVPSIPSNNHLLFLSCNGGGEEPIFVQRNRERWWDRQTTNSSLFYFTPERVYHDSCYTSAGPIAHIFISLKTPSRVRLRLVYRANNYFLLSIRQRGKTICTFSDVTPPDFKLHLQELEMERFEPGRHKLEVVVSNPDGEVYSNFNFYLLRDILIEFLDEEIQIPSPSEGTDHKDEIRTAIGAPYDTVEESSESPLDNSLPIPCGDSCIQDFGLKDYAVPQSPDEESESEI